MHFVWYIRLRNVIIEGQTYPSNFADQSGRALHFPCSYEISWREGRISHHTWHSIWLLYFRWSFIYHSDVIVGVMASQITSVSIVYSTVCSGAEQKNPSKLRITGLCEENLPVTGEFHSQRVSNAENVSIWCRHHVIGSSWSGLMRFIQSLQWLLLNSLFLNFVYSVAIPQRSPMSHRKFYDFSQQTFTKRTKCYIKFYS